MPASNSIPCKFVTYLYHKPACRVGLRLELRLDKIRVTVGLSLVLELKLLVR